jgi:uncharacterized protein (DUF302 family)
LLASLAQTPASETSEWEREMTQAKSQTIVIEHIRISSERPFAEVRRKLESTVPKLDPDIAEALRSGDQKKVKDYEENGPKLSIFGERDHGALLKIAGGRRNALQYDIGNPLTASKMTRYQLPAALYAPLRVVLFEDDHGRGIFEYDKPSSLFGQYGDQRVTEVGRYLDTTLESVLSNAAE